METRSRSGLAIGLGLVFWMFLLFSPLAWVGQAKADDTENYGTVIGIVSSSAARRPPLFAVSAVLPEKTARASSHSRIDSG